MTNGEREGHADLLSKVDLLAGLDRVTLAKLAAYLEPITLNSQEILFHQGDPGDAFYIVSKGSLGVHIIGKGETASCRVRTLLPGDPFGEMALLTNDLRTATIQADEVSEVLRLERVYFLELVNKQPSAALAIAATISRRLASVLHASQASDETKEKKMEVLEEEVIPTKKKSTPFSFLFSKLTLTTIFTLIVLFGGWLIPPPASMPLAGWHLLVSLIAFIPALTLNVLPEGIIALLLMISWILGGVVPAKVALVGFSTPGWVLIVSILLIGNGMASSGILYRVVLWAAEKMGGSYFLSILGLTASGFVISPAVPNATSHMMFISPLLTDLVEALGYAPKSRAAAGISMAALSSFGQMVGTTLTSSTTALLVYSILPSDSKSMLSWVSWVKYAAPLNITLLIGLFISIFYLYRPETNSLITTKKVSLKLQKTLLGSITKKEWWALFIGIGLLVGFITEPLHHIHPAWISVLALSLLAAVHLVTNETMKSINWSFVLLFGMLTSLSEMFIATHLDEWLSDTIGELFRSISESPSVFLIFFTLSCFLVSTVIRWQASAPLLTIALAPVASAMDINPLILGIIAVIACNIFFQPYQSTVYLALYHGTGERLFTHQQARPMAYAYAGFTLLGVIISIPFWRALGLV